MSLCEHAFHSFLPSPPCGTRFPDAWAIFSGAMFVVLRRSKGWWQVQRDPSGSGAVDDTAKRGWVPAGCLLETNVPPATAVAEATAQPNSPAALSLSSPAFGGHFPQPDAPILPSSIISTSYPGIALMDWLPQGDHELDLVKDDVLRVFKRYNHWSYVRRNTPAIPCTLDVVGLRVLFPFISGCEGGWDARLGPELAHRQSVIEWRRRPPDPDDRAAV